MRLGLLDDNTPLPVADIAEVRHRPDRRRLEIAALPVAPRFDREVHHLDTIVTPDTISTPARGEMLRHHLNKLPRITILRRHHDDRRRRPDLAVGHLTIELHFLKERIGRQPARHVRMLLREVPYPPFRTGPKRLLPVTRSTLMEHGEQILRLVVMHLRRKDRAIDPNPRAHPDQPMSGGHRTAVHRRRYLQPIGLRACRFSRRRRDHGELVLLDVISHGEATHLDAGGHQAISLHPQGHAGDSHQHRLDRSRIEGRRRITGKVLDRRRLIFAAHGRITSRACRQSFPVVNPCRQCWTRRWRSDLRN